METASPQSCPSTAFEKTWRWCRREPLTAGLAGVVALALLLGTAASTYFAVAATKYASRAAASALEADAEGRRANAVAQNRPCRGHARRR